MVSAKVHKSGGGGGGSHQAHVHHGASGFCRLPGRRSGDEQRGNPRRVVWTLDFDRGQGGFVGPEFV